MLHLVQAAVNPPLSLREAIAHWDEISWFLREAPRKRQPQMEKLAGEVPSLS
jgi:hypothetical protein